MPEKAPCFLGNPYKTQRRPSFRRTALAHLEKRNESILLAAAAVSAAACTVAGAFGAIGAADTFHTTLLCPVQVSSGKAKHSHENQNNNSSFHRHLLFL